MGPRNKRSALMFLLLVLMVVRANDDYIPPSAYGFSRTVSKAEELTPSSPTPRPGSKTDIQNRVILSIANGLSLALSLSPLFIRWLYGSWFITREIFPAKGVICTLVASATWTVYTMFQMYAKGNYAGEDVLLINSVTITSSVGVLLTYFLNGREHKKYWIFMIMFIIMVCCGMGWLVWHPNIIVSQATQNFLKRASRYSGIIGIALFALVNILPFADLWAMTCGDRTDLTLLMPMMLNTSLAAAVSAFWAIYAWVFEPIYPNYFMIANAIAAAMPSVQAGWLLVLRLRHKEVVGQITDVESLRSVFFSVSRSLQRLAEAPADKAFWRTTDYLLNLQDSLNIGWQSLSLIERTFSRLEGDLTQKVASRAAATAQARDVEAGANAVPMANQVAAINAAAAEACANAALEMCRNFLAACRANMNAFDAVNRAIKDKTSDPHSHKQGKPAGLLGRRRRGGLCPTPTKIRPKRRRGDGRGRLQRGRDHDWRRRAWQRGGGRGWLHVSLPPSLVSMGADLAGMVAPVAGAGTRGRIRPLRSWIRRP